MLDPELNRLFLEIFRTRGSVSKALNAMMKIGFLEYIIPEFAWVRFLPQHDVYHQYTVDLHTIAVLEMMDSFRREDNRRISSFRRFSRGWNARKCCSSPVCFTIWRKDTALGTKFERADGSANSATLGLPQEDIDDACFLILNHLAMTQLAFKKDLHDEALVSRFAENVMHKRRLDLLLLLTHADLRAVGPTAFSSWRRMLLEELYYRTLDIVEGEGRRRRPCRVDQADKSCGQGIDAAAAPRTGPGCISRSGGLPVFLDFYPALVVEHFTDLQSYLQSHGKSQMDKEDVIARKVDHPLPGYSSITLITRDRQGLFFRMAGTLSANRINILSAWSHSIEDIAVSTFHVNDIPEGPLDDKARWEHFQQDLKRVMSGEVDVDELVAARRASRRVYPEVPDPGSRSRWRRTMRLPIGRLSLRCTLTTGPGSFTTLPVSCLPLA